MSGVSAQPRTTIQDADRRIARIQDRLLDRTYVIILVTGIFAGIVSAFRMVTSGHQPAHTVHGICFGIVALTIIFRKQIPYHWRLAILLTMLFGLALAGLVSYGLIGLGSLFLICAGALTSVFGSTRLSWLILGLSSSMLVVVMLLFSNGLMTLTFDPEAYNRDFVSWLTAILAYVFFVGLLVTITTGLFEQLKNLADESMHQFDKIRGLYATLEQKVADRTEELAQSNKDKDRILGVVAHDINNKLAGTLGYLDLLLEHGDSLDDRRKQTYIEKAAQASQVAVDIVEDLLEFARGERDERGLLTEAVDICSFTQSTVECHLPQALEKQIELKMGYRAEHLLCPINRTKLSRVIDNLVTNAIKFTERGGVITVNVGTDQGAALLTVSDNGIGIPESIQSSIFEPFSSSGRPGTANERSTGLGLAISRRIVEQHDGEIWFESESGEGTTFYLKLPLDRRSTPTF